MQGKIIKGIAGFYYVHIVNKGVYECKAKGAFRNDKIKPLVGDNVEIDILDEEKRLGNVVSILERKNSLIRPAVANIDQAMIVFALKNPDPALNLLDRFLILMEMQGVKTVICFNKSDLAEDEYAEKIVKGYEQAGYTCVVTAAKEGINVSRVMELLEGKTTSFAGPSGVGKSTMLNAIMPEAESQTGELSEKLQRGKHTTRHSEIFNIKGDTYIMDTPGFSSLDLSAIMPEELKNYYPEFVKNEDYCKFAGCLHINEPVCGVKDEVEAGNISKERYENYKLLYEELKNIKRY